jgi:hypothetical protein
MSQPSKRDREKKQNDCATKRCSGRLAIAADFSVMLPFNSKEDQGHVGSNATYEMTGRLF